MSRVWDWIRGWGVAGFVVLVAGCASAARPRIVAPDAGPAPVVLDARFDEWAGVAPAVADPADAPAPHADVRGVQARHDADAVYLALEVERPVALQGLPGTLALLLDVDGDSATGWELHGLAGVDAAVEFSAALGRDGALMGTGLRLMDAEGRASCVGTANVAGIMAAPSHAARRFEIRIPRTDVIGFGERMTARLVATDADGGVVDRTDPFTIDLRDPAPRRASRGAGAADPLARAPGTDLRVVSWNVGREDLFRQPDAFGAILRALAPDLLVLDEVAGGHSAAEVEAVLNRILPGPRPWRAAYGVSGGTQRGVVAVRGAAPRLAAPFDQPLPYPDSMRAILPADGSSGARQAAERRAADGVPVTGAVVEVGGRRLLAVAVDLESGGTPGHPRDRLRRMEALAIRDALAPAIRAAGADGVIVAGDLNLVASPDPLDLLAAIRDDAGAPLRIAQPLRLDDASATTWENAEEPFTPGRLDFVLVGGAALEVAGGFVFASGDLSDAWRARHGVAADVSRVTDHLPLVTDLRWAAPR